MSISLGTKERYLLEDAKNHEQLCIEKYTNYSKQASDQQLKDIFQNHAIIMTEKYVSNAFNTAIYEFSDSNVRDVLNHIQKEEQKHGEAIFGKQRNV